MSIYTLSSPSTVIFHLHQILLFISPMGINENIVHLIPFYLDFRLHNIFLLFLGANVDVGARKRNPIAAKIEGIAMEVDVW